MALFDIKNFLKQELFLQGIPGKLLEQLPRRYKYNGNKLVGVDLSHMMIEKFPYSLMLFPDLEEINLSWNYVSRIPDQIEDMQRLDKINLARNALCALPKSFLNSIKLKKINLKANKIKELPNINWNLKGARAVATYQ